MPAGARPIPSRSPRPPQEPAERDRPLTGKLRLTGYTPTPLTLTLKGKANPFCTPRQYSQLISPLASSDILVLGYFPPGSFGTPLLRQSSLNGWVVDRSQTLTFSKPLHGTPKIKKQGSKILTQSEWVSVHECFGVKSGYSVQGILRYNPGCSHVAPRAQSNEL